MEYLTGYLVWIRMYPFRQNLWEEETLLDIGNNLGNFVKTLDKCSFSLGSMTHARG